MAINFAKKKRLPPVFVIGLAVLVLIPTGYFAYWYFYYKWHRG